MLRSPRSALNLYSLALHVVCLVLPVTSVQAIPRAGETWSRVVSKHFEIISNADADVAAEITVEFERFRAFMRLGEPEDNETTRTTVLAFKDEQAFKPYKKGRGGVVLDYMGVFTETPAGVYIALRGDLTGEPFAAVYHEYTHYHLSRKPLSVPLWFHEGLAEYLSTFRSKGNTVVLGEPIPAHVATLRSLPWMAIGQLFSVDASSPEYNESVRRSLFYAQSWALIHYLRHRRPDLFNRVQQLVEALNRGLSAKDAFEVAFQTSYRPFVVDMKEYFFGQGGTRYHEIDVARLNVDESIVRTEMPRDDLLYTLGSYLADTSPWEAQAAERHLRGALTLNPKHARAHAWLGVVLNHNGEHVEAKRHFDEAMQLAPNDDTSYFLRGLGLIERHRSEHPLVTNLSKQMPHELQDARGFLERAIQLNPRRGDAYAALGWTYVYESEDAARGIELLQRAHALMPSRMDVVYHLVALSMRAGDRELASALLRQVPLRGDDSFWFLAALQLSGQPAPRTVSKPLDPELEEQIGKTLDPERRQRNGMFHKRFSEAERAHSVGDFALALRILTELARVRDDDAMDVKLKAYVQRLTESAEKMITAERQLAMYRDAAEHARNQKFRAASDILEKLLRESIEDARLEALARDLYEQLGGKP